ncbi:MAG: hypothetical protein NTX45_02450 [Proteobacteria bacterium]|nr:hypothetical protein [Pseudomonadota bacterium]
MARPTANPASKATGLPQCRHGLFTLFTVSLPAFLFTVFTVDRVNRVSSSPRSLGPWGWGRLTPERQALPVVLALPGAVDRGQEGKSLSRCGRSAIGLPVVALPMVPACAWLRSPSSQTAKGRTPFAGRLGLGGCEGPRQTVKPCPDFQPCRWFRLAQCGRPLAGGEAFSRCGRSAWFRLARGFDHRPARPPRAGLLSPVTWALVDVKARARPSSPARISSLADGSGLPVR